MQRYSALFLGLVKELLANMSEIERAKVAAAISAMEEGNFQVVETKILKTPIRELKVKKYRLVFFINKQTLYFIHAFIKQTKKTPKKEIEYAYKIYKEII
jgi:phage-related protein